MVLKFMGIIPAHGIEVHGHHRRNQMTQTTTQPTLPFPSPSPFGSDRKGGARGDSPGHGARGFSGGARERDYQNIS